MDSPTSECNVCGKAFAPRFRYQVHEEAKGFVYFCSQLCQQQRVSAGAECAMCGVHFAIEHPFQVEVTDSVKRCFCSIACRSQAPKIVARSMEPRRIAVFNHKGGTGKTTTAVNLAAGLAERGEKVLLIDADGQGNVGASLGIRGERTLYHVLVHGMDAVEAAVPVRQNLDVLTSNETLAAAELFLAARPNRERVFKERLGDRVRGYDVVVVDCAPALSLMNQNVLVYADSVLVPVSCDYLSLIGVRQVLRTLKNVRTLLAHKVEILGVLPTFFDKRNRIAREAVDALEARFGDRCLPPIRVNTKLREAPSGKQTIFEHAPDSHGAEDYLALVDRIHALRGGGSSARAGTTSTAAVASRVFSRPRPDRRAPPVLSRLVPVPETQLPETQETRHV